jgi:hypothetical protein
MGQLNVEVYLLAKCHIPNRESHPGNNLIQQENGKDISTIMLYDMVHAKEAKQHWLSKDHVSTEDYQQVNWEAIEKVMKESQRTRIVFASKHASGMSKVGKFMVCWKSHQMSQNVGNMMMPLMFG